MNTQSIKTAHNNTSGFSLIELMVAVSISLVLLVGLIQIFISSKRSYNIQDSIARMQENGRYAVELLSSNLRSAGYIGGNADVTTINSTLGLATPDGNCVSNNDGQWGRMIARGVFGINDALTGYNCITPTASTPQNGQYLNGDVLTIRYTTPVNLEPDEPISKRGYGRGYYLKSSPMDGQLQLVNSTTADIDSFFLALTDNPVSYNKVEAYTYYSGFQQADCNGNATPVPTLYRLALSTNGTPQQQEMVRGVENLQVQYGIDDNDDGSPDQYHNANTVADWSQVKSVRLWLLIRDECQSGGYQNNNTYVMGDSDLPVDDNFRRHLYTTTVMLRNNEGI